MSRITNRCTRFGPPSRRLRVAREGRQPPCRWPKRVSSIVRRIRPMFIIPQEYLGRLPSLDSESYAGLLRILEPPSNDKKGDIPFTGHLNIIAKSASCIGILHFIDGIINLESKNIHFDDANHSVNFAGKFSSDYKIITGQFNEQSGFIHTETVIFNEDKDEG